MNDKELRYAILLNMLPGLGVRTQRLIADHFESFESIFKDHMDVLSPYPNILQKLKKGIRLFTKHIFIDNELNNIKKNNLKVYSIYCNNYPSSLRHIIDAPLLLFQKGGLELKDKKVLSIVGTRKPSPRARLVIDEILADLGVDNLVVVSGLAYGVDAFSHELAIKHKISTMGVLAHGLSMLYPAYNKPLADKMIDSNNALVSEFLYDEKPLKGNFPRRNRLIAGLCDGLLVVESNLRGGAMITAELAHSYHREVMAVPGRYDDYTSQGCIKLIKDHKAVMVTSADDIRNCLSWNSGQKIELSKPLQFDFDDCSKTKRQIYECINEIGIASIEYIAQVTQVSQNDLSLSLIDMELDGVLRLSSTGQYMIASKR